MSDKTVLTVVEKIEKVWPANDKGWIDIKLASGKRVSTKKPAIAEQARQFEGQTAAVEYVEIQNGQYTNRYAERFRAPAADETEPTPLESTVQQEMESVGAQRVNGSSRDTQIHRQSAAKVVAAAGGFDLGSASGLYAFKVTCDELVKYFESGE